jgi:hypothetical protein
MGKVNKGNPVFYQGKPCVSSFRLCEPLDTMLSLFYDCFVLTGGGSEIPFILREPFCIADQTRR